MLSSEKNRLCNEVYVTKEEVQEAETIQKYVEQTMQVEPMKGQTKWRNIEL